MIILLFPKSDHRSGTVTQNLIKRPEYRYRTNLAKEKRIQNLGLPMTSVDGQH